MKFYNYDHANKVVEEAWQLAISHLEKTLGDQYKNSVTDHAREKFWDYATQDITYMDQCPKCLNVVNGSEMMCGGICYDCYCEENEKGSLND